MSSVKRSISVTENLPSKKFKKSINPLKRPNPNTENPPSLKKQKKSLKLQNRLPDIEYTSFTVKIGLHKLLNENVLNTHIQTSVEKMTKLTYEGSLLANLITLYLINTNQTIPTLNQAFFQHVFKAVTAINKRQLNIPCVTADLTINFCHDFLYIPCHSEEKEWIDSRKTLEKVKVVKLYW
ncbi:784_t:CDS:2 [Entrophospora sp. SA101]|nr:784_t:CDS:2 [Entrophospora sp. SA101]